MPSRKEGCELESHTVDTMLLKTPNVVMKSHRTETMLLKTQNVVIKSHTAETMLLKAGNVGAEDPHSRNNVTYGQQCW